MSVTDYERWPTTLRPRSLKLFPNWMISRGAPNFAGRTQKRASDAGFWTGEMAFQISTPAQALLARGLAISMQGGLEPFRLGVFDDYQINHAAIVGGAPVSATLSGALAKGDMSIGLTVAAGTILRGAYFSIDSRLFVIDRDPATAGGVATVHVWPPSRIAKASGTVANFDDPTQLFELSDPKGGEMMIEARQDATVTLDLEESFEAIP